MNYLYIGTGIGLIFLAWYAMTAQNRRARKYAAALDRIRSVVESMTLRTYHKLKDVGENEKHGDMVVGPDYVEMHVYDTKVKVILVHDASYSYVGGGKRLLETAVAYTWVNDRESAWDLVVSLLQHAPDPRIVALGELFAEEAKQRRCPQPCSAA